MKFFNVQKLLRNLGLALFTHASPTDYVVHIKNGKTKNQGLGLSCRFGLTSKIVLVPTVLQEIPFEVKATTKDSQLLSVVGRLVGNLNAEHSKNIYDFSVDPLDGVYRNDGLNNAKSVVKNLIDRIIKNLIKEKDLTEIVGKESKLQNEISEKIAQEDVQALFSKLAFETQESVVNTVRPVNSDVASAFGAKEREAMLSDADNALHTRRKAAAKNQREIQQYELETKQKLEKDRANLVKTEGQNKLEAAAFDVQAKQKLLDLYKDNSDAKNLVLAFLTASDKGSLRELHLTPDLLNAIKGPVNS